MINLEKSVKLKLESSEVSNRILISPGSKLEISRLYHANSYTPVEQWSIPSAEQLSILLDKSDDLSEYNKTIKILSLPNEIKSLCNQIGFDAVLDRRDIRKNFSVNREIFSAFEEQLSRYLLSFGQIEGTRPIVHAFPIVTQGLHTITKRYINGIEDYLFCGLHIDCDSGASIKECSLAKNRISINLTSQPRELLYVNVSASEINTKFRERFRMSLDPEDSRDKLVRTFFENNPDYPVIKIKIMPYEAYIAPTDNVIHDATTLERTIEDVTLVALGKFEV